MIDPDHPFYAPLWRRVLLPAICAAWALFEFIAGQPIWGFIVGGLGAYAAYKFFLEKRPQKVEKPSQTPVEPSQD